MRRIAMGFGVLVLFLVTGCASVGSFPAQNITQVDLSRANYSVVLTNVEGTDTGWGLFLSAFGIPIVLDSPNDALNDLMNKVKADGRSVALINVSDNYRVTNWLLFYIKTRQIRGDVVEFRKEGPVAP